MCNKYHVEEHQFITDVVQSLVEEIPSVEGTSLLAKLKGRQFADIISCEYMDINTDPNTFRDNYLFASLFKKYPYFPAGLDRKAQAITAFRDGEDQCKRTNYELFSRDTLGNFPEVIRVHQKFMFSALGNLSRHKIDSILEKAYFGPGANVGTRNLRTALSDKMRITLTCTKELEPFALSIINEADPYLRSSILKAAGLENSIIELPISIVDGAKLSFVPKNAKTDRSITVEPLLNSFIQNGIGKYLRQLLKRKQIANLDNQDMSIALAGKSLQYGLDTIDLKNASNTLSTGLVKLSLALCPGWFHLLDLTRSRRYTLDKSVHTFQLFAGMGNGFTFPLESLIFYSLARATCLVNQIEPTITVYGDDIILPTRATPFLIEVFKSVGLTVNVEKSFTAQHPFREACGGYFYSGYPVKPPFVTQDILWDTTRVSLHNALWRWATLDGFSFDTRVVKTMRLLRKSLDPKVWGVTHPDLGDVGLHPLCSVGKGYMTHYKCRVPKATLQVERGAVGYWATMSRAMSRIDGGLEGKTDSPELFARRLPPSQYVPHRRKQLLYTSFQFHFIKV